MLLHSRKWTLKLPPNHRKTARSSLRRIAKRLGLHLTVRGSKNGTSGRRDLIEPTDKT